MKDAHTSTVAADTNNTQMMYGYVNPDSLRKTKEKKHMTEQAMQEVH